MQLLFRVSKDDTNFVPKPLKDFRTAGRLGGEGEGDSTILNLSSFFIYSLIFLKFGRMFLAVIAR